jgi:hypothetical protein
VAFCVVLRLDLTTDKERAGDPLVRAVWDYALGVLGGPPSGPMTYARFLMACETYQEPSSAFMSCLNYGATLFFLTDFTLSFGRLHDGHKLGDIFKLTGTFEVPELRHEIDDRIYIVALQDNRGISGTQWLETMNTQLSADRWEQPSLSALSRDEFAVQVREALRALHTPLALANNPLIHSRAARARLAPAAPLQVRSDALRALLVEGAEALRESLREDTLYRVLDVAYLKPVGKHEAAAAAIDMPYSTFRRHLTAAIQGLVAVLWEREIGSP